MNNSKYTFCASRKVVSSAEEGETKVHLLPFKISASGPANVSGYFDSITTPVTTSSQIGSTADKEQTVDHYVTSLYGREVKGSRIGLPSNVSAHVFLRNAADSDRIRFTEVSSSPATAFYQWKHDEVPGISDSLQANAVYLGIKAQLAAE